MTTATALNGNQQDKSAWLWIAGAFIVSRLIVFGGIWGLSSASLVQACKTFFQFLFFMPEPEGVELSVHPLLDNPGQPSLADIGRYWDGIWYEVIARDGYFYDGTALHRTIAHYPLFPWLSKLLAPVMTLLGATPQDSIVLAGMALNNVLFLGALWAMYRLVAKFNGDRAAQWSVMLLALFPGSYFCSSFLTESPFLAFSLFCALAAESGRFVQSSFWCALACLTRVNGLFLPLLVLLAMRKSRPTMSVIVTSSLVMAGGIAAYPIWLGVQYGDPNLYFAFHAQARKEIGIKKTIGFIIACLGMVAAFSTWKPVAQKRPHWVDKLMTVLLIGLGTILLVAYAVSLYVWITTGQPLMLPDHWFSINQRAMFVAMFFGLALLCTGFHRIPWQYSVFAAVLILPLLTAGALPSTHRYLIIAFPVFWILGIWASEQRTWVPVSLSVLFAVLLFLQSVLLSGYGWFFLF